MTQRRRVVDEVVVGGLQAGVDVRVAVRAEAEPVADGAEVDRRGPDRPVSVPIEGHDPELVGRRQRLGRAEDRLLGDVDLLEAALAGRVGRIAAVTGAVAVGHAPRLVNDRHHRHVRRSLAIAHRHVHRQRLLERRIEVPAGAIALASAEHDEAPAEIADVGLDRGHRRGAERVGGHVVQDQAVVRCQTRERRWDAVRWDDRHLLLTVLE